MLKVSVLADSFSKVDLPDYEMVRVTFRQRNLILKPWKDYLLYKPKICQVRMGEGAIEGESNSL
ncbi:MAG TPA: hypothetical protein GXX38_08340 [Clostridia bacterium]|nr:hypothetical protein [Clostridia bacterium]